MSPSVIDCPPSRPAPLPALRRRCNLVKENVANREWRGEEGWVTRGLSGRVRGVGMVWECPLGVRASSQMGRANRRLSRQMPHPVGGYRKHSRCKRLTQQGSAGQESVRPHLPSPSVSAGGTNLFQHPRMDKCETCHARQKVSDHTWHGSDGTFTRLCWCWYASLGSWNQTCSFVFFWFRIFPWC